MRLLILSNGHGEDEVAVAIARHLPAAWDVAALPLVGAGHAYEALACPILGTRKTLPSGGFLWGRPQAWWGDLKEGYLGDMRARWHATRLWVEGGGQALLGVGDVFPLLWASPWKLPFAHFDVAKSDRYLGGKPSCFGFWERRLLRQALVKASFFRDPVTASNLRELGVHQAQCLGNPMAEALSGLQPHEGPGGPLLLLPGSRPPEVHGNLARWLRVVEALHQRGVGPFRVALPAHLPFGFPLPSGWGWASAALLGPDSLVLAVGSLWEMASGAALALASAGTATEQVTGMGVPALLLAGDGPQFTPAFMDAQSRLLAGAVLPCASGLQVLDLAEAWWRSPQQRLAYGANGRALMGPSGAGMAIAQALARVWAKA